jgi:hypothetical protein
MVYHSQAWQDEFVANLLNFKRNGYFIDIGSTDGINQSNSYFFESELGWQGICVERGVGYTEHYKKNRTCTFLNTDALQVDYKSLLDNLSYSKQIDYLSVDIDENSSKVLSALPFDKYRFSVITIEHDAYRFGHTLRNEEREALRHHGYILLFSDVLVPLGCGMGPELPFEDWWIDPKVFNVNKLNLLTAEDTWNKKRYPDDIVVTLKNMNDVFLL